MEKSAGCVCPGTQLIPDPTPGSVKPLVLEVKHVGSNSRVETLLAVTGRDSGHPSGFYTFGNLLE